MTAPGYDKLQAYLRERYAAELAAGFMLAVHRNAPVLARVDETGMHDIRPIDLPSHLRPVRDVDAWHAAHQSGRNVATVGLPLFAEREDPTAQGSLF